MDTLPVIGLEKITLHFVLFLKTVDSVRREFKFQMVDPVSTSSSSTSQVDEVAKPVVQCSTRNEGVVLYANIDTTMVCHM